MSKLPVVALLTSDIGRHAPAGLIACFHKRSVVSPQDVIVRTAVRIVTRQTKDFGGVRVSIILIDSDDVCAGFHGVLSRAGHSAKAALTAEGEKIY